MSDEEVSDGGNPQPEPEVSGWADAMSRILGSNKPKKKTKLILSRAKKDYEVKQSSLEEVKKVEVVKKKPARPPRKERFNFEVVPSEPISIPKPEVVAEVIVEEEKAEEPSKRKKPVDDNGDPEVSLKKQRKLELKHKRILKEWENVKRIKPDPSADRETERDLQKIATKGVVELFNAVNLQKKTLGKKLRDAPKSEFKKDKILSQTKDLFEDALEKEHKKKR